MSPSVPLSWTPARPCPVESGRTHAESGQKTSNSTSDEITYPPVPSAPASEGDSLAATCFPTSFGLKALRESVDRSSAVQGVEKRNDVKAGKTDWWHTDGTLAESRLPEKTLPRTIECDVCLRNDAPVQRRTTIMRKDPLTLFSSAMERAVAALVTAITEVRAAVVRDVLNSFTRRASVLK
jgi:hypothetical protein